jgi:hypothetical protein
MFVARCMAGLAERGASGHGVGGLYQQWRLGRKWVDFSSVFRQGMEDRGTALDWACAEGHPGWKHLTEGALRVCFGACLDLRIRPRMKGSSKRLCATLGGY